MGAQGRTTAQIIGFYYGGARPAPAPPSAPATLRVGLLQARGPGGARSNRLLLRPLARAGVAGSGRVLLAGVDRAGRGFAVATRPGGAGRDLVARPLAGGVAVYDGPARLAGPTRAGSALAVRVDGPLPASLLALPQLGRGLLLAHGSLQVAAVRDERGVARLRAVAVMGLDQYLAGLGEVPGSWPTATLAAQAIAARSYALAVARRGQHRGAAAWDGCDCGVYGDARDQAYAGWAKESGAGGARWVAAVRATARLVVVAGGRLVQAFYSASSGGYTESTAAWGDPSPPPWFPSKPDPYDAAGGRNPSHRWSVTFTAAQLSARLSAVAAVGTVAALEVTAADPSGRVTRVRVTGSRGTAVLGGARLAGALGLRSRRFRVVPPPAAATPQP
jgi:SpoIID/LytB domain protein